MFNIFKRPKFGKSLVNAHCKDGIALIIHCYVAKTGYFNINFIITNEDKAIKTGSTSSIMCRSGATTDEMIDKVSKLIIQNGGGGVLSESGMLDKGSDFVSKINKFKDGDLKDMDILFDCLTDAMYFDCSHVTVTSILVGKQLFTYLDVYHIDIEDDLIRHLPFAWMSRRIKIFELSDFTIKDNSSMTRLFGIGSLTEVAKLMTKNSNKIIAKKLKVPLKKNETSYLMV